MRIKLKICKDVFVWLMSFIWAVLSKKEIDWATKLRDLVKIINSAINVIQEEAVEPEVIGPSHPLWDKFKQLFKRGAKNES
jgi:hypothetical protein